MIVDLNYTLEQIDKKVWDEPNFNSHLVKSCHQLRKKPLKDFTVEDLRIMIGQNFNLEVLLPIAVEQLKKNILSEGIFYEGDLLKSVLDSDINYWTKNRELWLIVKELYFENRQTFESDNIFKHIRKCFEQFEKI